MVRCIVGCPFVLAAIVLFGVLEVNTHQVGNKSGRLAGSRTALCLLGTMSGLSPVDACLRMVVTTRNGHKRWDNSVVLFQRETFIIVSLCRVIALLK